MITDAFKSWTSATTDATPTLLAGTLVSPERETKTLLNISSASSTTNVLKLSQLHLFKQILNSVLKRSAQTSGPNAMPNARLLSTNVKRNAVERYHAGLSAFLERVAKQPSMSQSVLKPTTACLLSIMRKFLMLLQILEILSNALKRSAPTSGQPARKTPSVFLLSRTVRRNAELRALAGPFASLQREAKPQSMLPSVPKPTNALV